MAQNLSYRLDMEPRSQWQLITVDGGARQNLLYLQEAGLFYAGPAYYTTRDGLDSYLLKVTLSGRGRLEYQGKSYSLDPGSFFWIDCRQPQTYGTDPDADHWHVLWVHFYGAGAEGYYSLFQDQNKSCPVGRLPTDSGVRGLLETLLALYQKDEGELAKDVRAAGLLNQTLCQCLEAVCAAKVRPTPPPVIDRVRSYLADHFAEKLTLDDLSTRFSMSKYHLQRTFQRYLGVSPLEYQMKLRMAKAKELLRTTELPVSLVAFSVGMDSASYFISAFRRQEGVTPLKYRAAWSDR